jgi:hypothetical protein
MKKSTLLLVLCALIFSVNAQVLHEEKFTEFPDINNNFGIEVNGWLNWASNVFPGGIGNDNRTVIAPALSYSDAGGLVALSGVGNSLFNNYLGGSNNNYLTYKKFSDTQITSGTVYMSFLFSVVKAGGSQGEIVGLTDSIHRNSMRCWIRQGTDATNFKLGFTRSSGTSADIINSTRVMLYGTTYLVVYKYEFSSGTGSFYVNPSIGSTSEPTADISDNTKGVTRTALQYICFRNGGNNKAYYHVSGLKVCQSWTDAVAAFKSELPKLNAPVTLAASNIQSEAFTANWNPVSNATGYSVFIFKGTELFNKIDVDGQSTGSATVTGLISNTSYSYKVMAKADNVSYANSENSESSSTVTTYDGLLLISTDFSDGSWGTVYDNTSEPLTGTYPSFSNNGFELKNIFVSSQSKTGPNGEVHTHSLKFDKGSTGSMFIMPSMKKVARVEIHAWTGTAVRRLLLQELLSSGWSTISTFTTGAVQTTDTIFTQNLIRENGTKLRIVNGDNGGLNVGQVIVESVPSGVKQLQVKNPVYVSGKNIISRETGNMEVFNLQGVRLNYAENTNLLNTDLSSGIYIVRFTGLNKISQISKIQIQ